MTVSDKDKEFMKQVAAYYLSTKEKSTEHIGSIRNTALKFGLTRTKIQKILISMGVYSTELSDKALKLKNDGLSLEDIAAALNLSKAYVSSLLPYTDIIHNTAEPSVHTASVRGYRAYERELLKRIKNRNSSSVLKKTDEIPDNEECFHNMLSADKDKTDSSFSPDNTAFADSNDFIKNNAEANLNTKTSGAHTLNEFILPDDLICLHIELEKVDDNQSQILKKLGGVKNGRTITRDIIVKSCIPLRALHYILQRAFGFTESHLHCFYIDDATLERITGNNIKNLKNLHGVVFTLDEPDIIYGYEPVYNGGSFKKWLRRQYTAPYNYNGDHLNKFHLPSDSDDFDYLSSYEQGLLSIVPIDKELYLLSKIHDNAAVPTDNSYFNKYEAQTALPETIAALKRKTGYVKWRRKDKSFYSYTLVACDEYDPKAMKYTKVKLGDLNIRDGLKYIYNDNLRIIERLRIQDVLKESKNPYTSDSDRRRRLTKQLIISDEMIDKAIKKNRDIIPSAFTDTLYYKYDYGDSWTFKISAYKSCDALIRKGLVTKGDYVRSVRKAQREGVPVLLYRDGDMLIEDCGGVAGFTEFLERVNLDPACIIHQHSDFMEPEFFLRDNMLKEENCNSNFSSDNISYGSDFDYFEDNSTDPFEENTSELNASDYGVPDDRNDLDENYMTKAELLDWALSLGWHRNDASNLNLL